MKTVNKPELLCFGPDTLCKVEPTSLILNCGINFFQSISWCWFPVRNGDFGYEFWDENGSLLILQKLGLVHSLHHNPETAKFIRNLMAIPFLPASLIRATYAFLQVPGSNKSRIGKIGTTSELLQEEVDYSNRSRGTFYL